MLPIGRPDDRLSRRGHATSEKGICHDAQLFGAVAFFDLLALDFSGQRRALSIACTKPQPNNCGIEPPEVTLMTRPTPQRTTIREAQRNYTCLRGENLTPYRRAILDQAMWTRYRWIMPVGIFPYLLRNPDNPCSYLLYDGRAISFLHIDRGVVELRLTIDKP